MSRYKAVILDGIPVVGDIPLLGEIPLLPSMATWEERLENILNQGIPVAAKYDGGVNSPAPAINAGLAGIWTPTARSARVLKVEIVATAVTTTDVGLQRTTARGTQTATMVGQALDPLTGASTVQLDSTWSAQPTFSGNNLKRILLNAAGAGMAWTWDDTDPLVVSAASGLCMRNVGAGAGGVCSCSYEWDEG